MAAKAGQMLLEKNSELQEELDALKKDEKDRTDKIATSSLAEIETLKIQRETLVSKNSQLGRQLEESETERFELSEEVASLRHDFQELKKKSSQDTQEIRALRDLVETQKQAISQLTKIDDENKKSISRLQKEGQRLSVQVSTMELSQMSTESMSSELKKQRKYVEKLEEEKIFSSKIIEQLKDENEELKDLLQDKEEMANTVQYLLQENEKYRKDWLETQQLLTEAKQTAELLRFDLQQSLMVKESTRSRSSTLEKAMATSPGNANSKWKHHRDEDEEVGKLIDWFFTENIPAIAALLEQQQERKLQKDLSNQLQLALEEGKKAQSQTNQTTQKPTGDNEAIAEIQTFLHDLKTKAPSTRTSLFQGPETTTTMTSTSFSKEELKEEFRKNWREIVPRILDNRKSVTRMAELSSFEKKKDLWVKKWTDFREKSNSFNTKAKAKHERKTESKETTLREREFILSQLKHKLTSAETRLKDMTESLDALQKKEILLEEMNKKLVFAEEKIEKKEKEIEDLQQKLKEKEEKKEFSFVLEGFLTKRGQVIKSWKKRWFSISSDPKDMRLYYGKSNQERVIGMVQLQQATIRKDNEKKWGKEFCFEIITESRTWQLFADDEVTMNQWINVLQQKCAVFKKLNV